jgi:hypothetical protein
MFCTIKKKRNTISAAENTFKWIPYCLEKNGKKWKNIMKEVHNWISLSNGSKREILTWREFIEKHKTNEYKFGRRVEVEGARVIIMWCKTS